MTSSTSASEAASGPPPGARAGALALVFAALGLAALVVLGRQPLDPWDGADPLAEPPKNNEQMVILGNSIAAADLDPAVLGARSATLQGSQSWHWAAVAQQLRAGPWSDRGVLLCAPLRQLSTAPPPALPERALLEGLLDARSLPPAALRAAAGGHPAALRLHRGRRRVREAVLGSLVAALPRALQREPELDAIRAELGPLPLDPLTRITLPSAAGAPGRAGPPDTREGVPAAPDDSALPLLVDALGAGRLTVILPPVAPDQRSARPCATTPRQAATLRWLADTGVAVLDGRAAELPAEAFQTRHHLDAEGARHFSQAVAQALSGAPAPTLGPCHRAPRAGTPGSGR